MNIIEERIQRSIVVELSEAEATVIRCLTGTIGDIALRRLLDSYGVDLNIKNLLQAKSSLYAALNERFLVGCTAPGSLVFEEYK